MHMLLLFLRVSIFSSLHTASTARFVPDHMDIFLWEQASTLLLLKFTV